MKPLQYPYSPWDVGRLEAAILSEEFRSPKVASCGKTKPVTVMHIVIHTKDRTSLCCIETRGLYNEKTPLLRQVYTYRFPYSFY